MRTLTAHNTTETELAVTNPFYLIDIGFDVNLRLSTLSDYVYETYQYSADRKIDISSIKTDSAGNQTALVKIDDIDNFLSLYILSEGCAGKTIDIYEGYGDPAYADIVQIFKGQMDEASINDTTVTIKIISDKTGLYSTGLVLNGTYFKHMKRPGTIIKTGNAIITLREAYN